MARKTDKPLLRQTRNDLLVGLLGLKLAAASQVYIGSLPDEALVKSGPRLCRTKASRSLRDLTFKELERIAKEWDGRLARQAPVSAWNRKDGRDARPTLSAPSEELEKFPPDRCAQRT